MEGAFVAIVIVQRHTGVRSISHLSMLYLVLEMLYTYSISEIRNIIKFEKQKMQKIGHSQLQLQSSHMFI